MPSSACALASPRPPSLSLHDALPISALRPVFRPGRCRQAQPSHGGSAGPRAELRCLRSGSVSRRSVVGATGPNRGCAQLGPDALAGRSEEHTSELQSPCNLVCRLLLVLSPAPDLPPFPYTTLFRSQLYVLYFGLADVVRLNPLTAAVLGLALNYAAYEAEVYRGALSSVPQGQTEAARSLGLTRWQADRKSTRLNSSHLVISYAVFCLCSRQPPTSLPFPTRRSSDLSSTSCISAWPMSSGSTLSRRQCWASR